MDAILSVQEHRVVANDYTVQFQNRLVQISKESVSSGLRKGKVLIESRLDGSIHVRFHGCYLKCHEIDQERRARKVASTDAKPVALHRDVSQDISQQPHP